MFGIINTTFKHFKQQNYFMKLEFWKTLAFSNQSQHLAFENWKQKETEL